MIVDELARRRALNAAPSTRRVAGARRRPPPETDSQPMPGDAGVMLEDLRQIKAMTEEVMAEALALGDSDVTAAVGALVLHVSDVAATVEQLEGGD